MIGWTRFSPAPASSTPNVSPMFVDRGLAWTPLLSGLPAPAMVVIVWAETGCREMNNEATTRIADRIGCSLELN